MLCSKHFKSTCFNENKLFRTAVPGVHLADEPAVFVPVAGPSTIIYPLKEHDANIIPQTSYSEMFVCKSSKQGDQKNKILIRNLKSSMNKVYRLQKTFKK